MKRLQFHINRLPWRKYRGIPEHFVLQKELLRGIAKGMPETIFDIGAHTGETVQYYRRLFPKSRIFAFEPNPELYQFCQQRFQEDKKVSIHQFAVGAENKQETMFINNDSATSSLKKSVEEAEKNWGRAVYQTVKTENVKVVTLDRFCGSIGVDVIHICKVDVQGHEMEVLRGAQGLLAQSQISLLQLEWINLPTYEKQTDLGQMIALMLENKYELNSIYNLETLSDGKLAQADLLFASKAAVGTN